MKIALHSYRRTQLLSWGLLVIGALFILRLFWLQVIQHDYYAAQASAEHVTQFTLPAKRGVIYVKDGNSMTPIVLNEVSYLAYADPSVVNDKQKVIDAVRSIAGGTAVDGFDKRLNNTESRYSVLAKNLSKSQAELLRAKKLAGVGFTPGERRVYPENKLAGQVLGYVNGDGKGQYGIEGVLDARLKGTPGELKAVTDVRQIPLTISDDYVNRPAKDGDDLVLSIDRNVQSYAESALKAGLDKSNATKGSVVVMDPSDGRVMAMANYPDYSPADYATTDYSLFTNKAVSDSYEAGSIVKTFTMGAGLDSGAVTTASVYDDSTGCVQVEDRKICNVEEDPLSARATMLDVLHYSLNTGVVFVEKQMGGGEINGKARQTLHNYFYNQYGFGQQTGIEQAAESAGVIHSPTDGNGLNVLYATMAFGQGMQITSLQAAAAFSAAINGGTYYQPTVIQGVRQDDGSVKDHAPTIKRSGVLKQATSIELRDMIAEARKKGILGGADLPGYIVGGKTGTAQVIDPVTGQYSDKNSVGTYIGFGGGKTPRYVIMVKVDDANIGGYEGTTAAAPIFADVSNWLLKYLQVDKNQ